MTDLPHFLNWRRINDRITTSGQPTEAQMAELKALGITQVINLGIHHDGKGALEDEPATVAALGLGYTYIPVDFENPTDADYEAFKAALEEHKETPIHVHCIYNARVSAFFYRYAKEGMGMALEEAVENLESIWRPGSNWAGFIDEPVAGKTPNRYAGEDY